jgi:hypothetical protein
VYSCLKKRKAAGAVVEYGGVDGEPSHAYPVTEAKEEAKEEEAELALHSPTESLGGRLALGDDFVHGAAETARSDTVENLVEL